MNFVGIDPSTKTGIVRMDEAGNVLFKTEINESVGSFPTEPGRINDVICKTLRCINRDDIVAIEGFSFNSTGSYVGQQYAIGWGIRIGLHVRGQKYIEVSPHQLKKFVTGKGAGRKEDLILPIFQRWGFQDTSDNIRDGFVLAQIARALHVPQQLIKPQQEVINAILNPPSQKPKTKKPRGK
ncbi:hypothetical protein YDYSY3_57540 [Paenibacillus chitinolyticus]|uniref:hypothetical protein n=1 Tax=Paenibacillus chitinolyticus TaxID=79263 RepID=UPI0026E4CAF1|nr:hypothetical protein [Paenibacillus chitinolyticus]GKS14754.1 hypothetical protein YDYSY3_57540 [Paenibacillus chitinolyticus]